MFEDKCFEFQQKIIDIINGEEQLPFLVKYYLIKQIWDSISERKMSIDIEVRQRHPLEPIVLTTDNLENNEEK